MSKNKNPLKDLDLFLKQQASSLVSPTPLSERVKKEEMVATDVTPKSIQDPLPIISDQLATQLEELAQHNKPALYDLLIELAEREDNPKNAMLINTVLYLKNGDNWEHAVREYWRNRQTYFLIEM
jgi:hypothetical protein